MKKNDDIIEINVDLDISDYIPSKSDAYVSYNPKGKRFYVSTTDEDEYDGYTTMDAIVDLFIEGYEHIDGGRIDNEDAAPFIEDLENAIKKIKARIRG